ncbi:MAG: hypothetical protein CW338_06030, partial [Clostridiales bacterium]|nr:hypothetical protein [Clostridiales bacterium]
MRTGRTLRLLACLLALICMMGCVSVASADHASDCKQGKHVMGPWEVWEYPGATCGDYVLRTRHCKYCRYTEDEDYLLQHNWSEWTVETPPKDGNPGILKRYCKRCGKVEYKYYYDETPEKKLDLAVEIISPPKAEYHVGDDIEIAITLTNRGSVTLTSPWAGFYSGNRGVITVLTRTAVVLEPNESAHFGPEQGVHYTYTVDEYDVKNGKIEFTAYGSAYDPNGEQVDSNEETFEFPAGFTAKLGLSVQVLNPKAYYDENDVISFALIPRNESDITLYDPAVCMVFDSGRVDASWTGFVAPTDVVIFDENSGSPFEYTVTASDVSKGTVILKFSARAFIDSDTSPDGYAVYSETVELEYPTTAKYASIFLKVEGDEYTPLHEGEQTVLTITVTNTGTVPVEKTLIYHTIANADIWDPSQLDGMLLPDMSISGSYTLTVAPGDVTEAKRDFVARSRYGLPDEEDNYPLVWSNNATFEVPVERPGMDKVPVLDVKEYFRGRPENHSGDPVDFYWSVTNEGPEEYKIVSVECSVDGGADTDIAYFYPAKEMTPNGGYETGKWTEPLPLTFGSNIIATYKFYALVEDSSGELKVTNTVNIPVSVIDTIFDPVPSTLVAVDKIEKSHSTDPLGYVSGEKVIYLIKVTNVCSETLYDIEVTDPLKGENEDAVIDVIPKLEPNEYKELTFEYTVTDMDCAHGQILNQATASWIDPATEKRISIQSLEVKVDTLKGFTPSVIKYDAGVPDMHIDGAYYIPGDIIHFVIEIENHTGFTFTEVKVYDPLQPDKYLAEYEELKPGEHKTIDFYYTVKDSDCIPPYLYNQAVVFFLISGDRSRASSDEVSVPVGIPKEVVVTKKETSVPDNAAYLAPEDAYYT